MEVSAQRLLFECGPGRTACASLAVSNRGSTCLHYRWERLQPPHHRRHPANLFHLPDQTGAVLPGASRTFWCALTLQSCCSSGHCIPALSAKVLFCTLACGTLPLLLCEGAPKSVICTAFSPATLPACIVRVWLPHALRPSLLQLPVQPQRQRHAQ